MYCKADFNCKTVIKGEEKDRDGIYPSFKTVSYICTSFFTATLKLLNHYDSSHPNIVAFWESFWTPKHLHIVMEFADGGDLENFVKRRKTSKAFIPQDQVLHLFVQISLAIKHIHDRKILHRDLKSQV